jgi:hypothetical protein
VSQGCDSLFEGVVRRLSEMFLEGRLSGETQQEGALAVVVGDGEKAQSGLRGVGYLTGLVDDQQVLPLVGK